VPACRDPDNIQVGLAAPAGHYQEKSKMKYYRLSILIVVVALLAIAGGRAWGQDDEPAESERENELLQVEPLALESLLGTAFTYQGHLRQSGTAVSGACDFQFGLYDAVSGGAQIAATQTKSNVAVSGGLFTVADLDFGAGAFNGLARWLAIGVRCPAGSGSYTPLTPRQALTPAPYALALPGFYTLQNATSPNLIGGHISNTVASGVVGATIGGGGYYDAAAWPSPLNASNKVTASYGTVGGGALNTASAWNATVGGGSGNTASAWNATVGGGSGNTASGSSATVGGGSGNTASGSGATVGGGSGNTASGSGATVGGGSGNTASGQYATVPGGRSNLAQGDYSFAAGRAARANNTGCFVWGDNSTTANVTCENNNRWLARSSGGVYFYTSSNLSSGVYVGAGGSAWLSASDRALKENLTPVDGREVLAQLADLPLATWNYLSEDAAVRHMGPMAQDFYAAFGLGDSERHISTIDADGVALAAIQGLYEIVQAQEEEIAGLEARLAALEKQVNGKQAALPTRFPGWLALALGGLAAGLVWNGRQAGRR
jgi:hypothetical protein